MPETPTHGESGEQESDDPYAPSAAVLAAPAELAEEEEAAPEDFLGLRRPGFIGICLMLWGPARSWMNSVTFDDNGHSLLFAGALIVLAYAVLLRLRNLGYSGWFAPLVAIPYVGAVLVAICIALPENYSKHKRLDVPAFSLMGGMGLLLTAWFVG